MTQRIGLITLVVDDYDEAISYFTGKLGFALVDDTALGGGKRWVVVAPRGAGSGLLLAKAVNERQKQAVGAQTGGRVFLFLHTDSCTRTISVVTMPPARSAALRLSRSPARNLMAPSSSSPTSTAIAGT
jgi:catechol 2,3-dioxygenase-like lactoylglutathione lyase family enzyme